MRSLRAPSFLSVVIVCLVAGGCSAPAPAPALPQGDYFGQTPPGETAELFAPGVVSTYIDELNSVFSPDGKTFLVSAKLPGMQRHTLMAMERTDAGWTGPEVLPFSGRWDDADPCFSPDGQEIFFISQRPIPEGHAGGSWDIWKVAREGEGWGEPVHLDAPINGPTMEIYPSVVADGTLYFSSGREGSLGGNDIYRARPDGAGGYLEPENLGPPVSTAEGEGDLFVAPDESYLIVTARREGGQGRGDLYVSFQAEDGTWSEPANLGDAVNTKGQEYCPMVSPDGRYLFFTSYRGGAGDPGGEALTRARIEEIYARPDNGLGDIYWVDARVLEKVRIRGDESER